MNKAMVRGAYYNSVESCVEKQTMKQFFNLQSIFSSMAVFVYDYSNKA